MKRISDDTLSIVTSEPMSVPSAETIRDLCLDLIDSRAEAKRLARTLGGIASCGTACRCCRDLRDMAQRVLEETGNA